MTLNHKLLDAMILPAGTSLEDFDIFEGSGGVPILLPIKRVSNPIDELQGKQGREWITNCSPAIAQEHARELSRKEYDNVVITPGGYTITGCPQPKESMSAIYGTKKNSI